MVKSSKKITGYIKLTIPSGEAKPSPPVGPALGQKGLKIMDFCKSFNEQSGHLEKGTPVPVVITVYFDKSFDFIMKTPPVSFYLKKYAKVNSGAKSPKKEDNVGTVKMSDCFEIAKIKMQDLNTNSIDAAVKMILGSANSMGIEVIE